MSATRANPAILIAIALTSAVLLTYQIAATRILSATTSYHATFGVIALVMLGLAASGTRLYIDRKQDPGADGRTARALLWGAGTTILGMFLVVLTSLVDLGGGQTALATATSILAFFPPFYFSGYAIAAILTDYAADAGRVYWADLVGAAVGCFMVTPILALLDPIQLGFCCAALLGVAAAAEQKARGVAVNRSLGIGAVGLGIVILSISTPIAQLQHAKGVDVDPLWTQWNHLNRVTVYPELNNGRISAERMKKKYNLTASIEEVQDRAGIGWGISSKFDGKTPDIRYILLDHHAGTPIIKGGVDADLEILKWDVTSIGYHVLGSAPENVFVIGGGGGRDILSAKAFDATHVDVVELNESVYKLVNEDMADYSNRPYSAEGVKTSIGDARSELLRRETKFDLIQMSMIDTWASSSSGAMVLTENVLYTQEAFDIYRDRLADGGILSIARWYDPETYGEVGRLLAMLGDCLQRGGVEDLESHVAIAYTEGAHGGFASTALLKMEPFTDGEIERLFATSDKMGFTMLWPVKEGQQPEVDVSKLLRGEDPAGSMHFELTPATDDRPFFFNNHRPFASYIAAMQDGDWDQVSRATTILLFLAAIAAMLSRIMVLGPLRKHGTDPSEFPRPARRYFACLGLGFLFVELALIQRLTIYLGHPTYALAIVLATLLLFGGVGSYLSQRVTTARGVQRVAVAVVGWVLYCAIVLPFILDVTLHWGLVARQLLAVFTTLPIGVALGMMYPSGLRLLVASDRQSSVPWAWAINGVWGVMASILGMLLAMAFGYGTLLLAGGVAYLIAALSVRGFEQ